MSSSEGTPISRIANRQTILQECLVAVINASTDQQAEWAIDYLNEELSSKNLDRQQLFLHCGRCTTTICLDKSQGIKVWPPGCDIGESISQ